MKIILTFFTQTTRFDAVRHGFCHKLTMQKGCDWIMKGPGIKDYLQVIQEMKMKAHEEGVKYIDVSSKKLHEQVSPNHATMPTCCQAIYKLMLEGDEILRRPKGQTGFGSHLDVRFYTDNLEGRAAMFPPKKRGRPAKDEETRRQEKLMRSNRTTESLLQLVTVWLNERGWETEVKKNVIIARKEDVKWLINVQGSKRGRKQPLPVKLNNILKEIDDMEAQYSIAFNDSTMYRKQWNDLPRILKSKLNMSVLLADKVGNIQEVK